MPPFESVPVAWVIFALTILTTVVAWSNAETHRGLMLHPYSINRGQKVYTILTSGFIHLDFPHLIMNMVTFYYFAFPLEQFLGHWQFGFLYIAGMALADLSTILKYKDFYGYYSLGASGAVSAALFSFILFAPGVGIRVFFIPVDIPAVIFGVLYLVYSVYASRKDGQINHEAHFYGAVAGMVITVIFQHSIIPHFISEVKALLP